LRLALYVIEQLLCFILIEDSRLRIVVTQQTTIREAKEFVFDGHTADVATRLQLGTSRAEKNLFGLSIAKKRIKFCPQLLTADGA
jgi:hypothetical protein